MRASAQLSVISVLPDVPSQAPLIRRLQRRPIPASTAVAVDSGNGTAAYYKAAWRTLSLCDKCVCA
jgi:hypothetical protein